MTDTKQRITCVLFILKTTVSTFWASFMKIGPLLIQTLGHTVLLFANSFFLRGPCSRYLPKELIGNPNCLTFESIGFANFE